MLIVVGALNRTVRRYCFMLRISVVFFCKQSMTNSMCELSSFKNLERTISCGKSLPAIRVVFRFAQTKCSEKITHSNAHFIDDIHPLAKMMFPLAEKAVAKEDYKDVAYFEPFYLKEFVASLPKKVL